MTRSGFMIGLEEILGIPKRTLRQEDDRMSVPQWTSLADVKVFSFICSEFGIEADDELIEAATVGDLLRILENRGAFESSLTC
jgi:hypothetical protein